MIWQSDQGLLSYSNKILIMFTVVKCGVKYPSHESLDELFFSLVKEFSKFSEIITIPYQDFPRHKQFYFFASIFRASKSLVEKWSSHLPCQLWMGVELKAWLTLVDVKGTETSTLKSLSRCFLGAVDTHTHSDVPLHTDYGWGALGLDSV